jgi:glutamate dehydrogenase
MVPDPKPAIEVFVYSPRIEGVHLRGGKVARGGLRWSDRYEDYRTEVLGLVKAQQVKNAIIVPVGAKGGFVAKRIDALTDREAIQQEGIACYRIFIQGLLDVTDNLLEGDIQPPPAVIRHDDDDPYLVVAADKGTATFSDIANELAERAQFWLGDAFASGGSNGYDHKKMGITARGAWVSVQRHFQAMGIDVQTESIRVVGIGDMAGDVFGNGLLRSDQVKLVAAFNHQHIFIDPDPDPVSSFAERLRLFELPRSSWDDYDRTLISEGGAVLSRHQKSIRLTPQMQTILNTTEEQLPPNEVIQKLLCAEVDLLWNGGIGTYIKARTESHADVGDKANDGVRVNGDEVGAKVLGEGGNLGATQLGRIEFALKGGRCFTDFIDNAGGVDCSDHEVNIKICLDELVKSGELTLKHRNQKLQAMTDEVAALVLHNNAQQTLAIELAHHEARWRVEEYRRLMTDFEQLGKLDRRLEFLPDDESLSQRKVQGVGLTRPELSILIAYVKGDLKEALIQQNAGDDSYLAQSLYQAFPETLVKDYPEPLLVHRLRREIVATQLANDLYNHMSFVFVHRLKESTGANELEITKAYVAARDVLDFKTLWQAVLNSPKPLDPKLQTDLLLRLARSVRRATRSLIKVHRQELSVQDCVDFYQKPMRELVRLVPEVVSVRVASTQNEQVALLQKAGIQEDLLPRLALSDRLHEGLGIVRTAQRLKMPLKLTARVHILLGDRLALGQFMQLVSAMPVGSHWQALAREALRDDIDSHQQRLTESVLNRFGDLTADAAVAAWLEQFDPLVQRWLGILQEIMATSEPEMSLYSIAGRELMDLVESSQGA